MRQSRIDLARWALLLTMFTTLLARGDEPADDQSKPGDETAPPKTIDPRAMEVRFTDDSVLMLVIVDEQIEIVTPHGKLWIPTDDIQRIQFAQRIPTELQAKIDAAIENLGHADEAIATAAEAQLFELKDKAYRAVAAAERSTNERIASRAAALREKLDKQLGEAVSTMRGDDVIESADDRIVGKISVDTIRVSTSQFGELSMKLADVRNLRSQSFVEPQPEEEVAEVLPDPGNLQNYASFIDKTFHFRVTGASGSIYGSDVYTTDSELAAAAVHAGIVAVGETGVVTVKIVTPPPSFASTTRHGITSYAWGPYPSAYQVVKGKGKKEATEPQSEPDPPRRDADPFGGLERK